jgi:hypothetical protein
MATLRRILPYHVKRAYERKGLKPTRYTWIDSVSKRCCPLTAVMLRKSYVMTHNYAAAEALKESRRRGYDELYINAFLGGYDNALMEVVGEQEMQGYADGKAVYEAIKDQL